MPLKKGNKEGKGAQQQGNIQRQSGNIPTSWEEALLKPELQVIFSRKNADTELSNAKREALVSESCLQRKEGGLGNIPWWWKRTTHFGP